MCLVCQSAGQHIHQLQQENSGSNESQMAVFLVTVEVVLVYEGPYWQNTANVWLKKLNVFCILTRSHRENAKRVGLDNRLWRDNKLL